NGFMELYNQFCFSDLDRTCYDDEMTEFLLNRNQPQNDKARHQLERLIWMFYCQVYSNAWRYHFLEKLDEAGTRLALYGNNWDQHARLKHLGRGPVEHGPDLNQVYNFNKISLSINHFVTMNQRISECALAGGFAMVASHPTDKDGIDARNYLRENEDVVFFDSAADLIDKSRYYLDHHEERKRIAENARSRAQAGLTVDATARQMLQQWRELL
ncbi:MAG: glycosyltransferase family 1 protein, partial [Planctomycetes bacterium]|nr:glycosyltransferase family 1 protein [Planctomycetota bacterium]